MDVPNPPLLFDPNPPLVPFCVAPKLNEGVAVLGGLVTFPKPPLVVEPVLVAPNAGAAVLLPPKPKDVLPPLAVEGVAAGAVSAGLPKLKPPNPLLPPVDAPKPVEAGGAVLGAGAFSVEAVDANENMGVADPVEPAPLVGAAPNVEAVFAGSSGFVEAVDWAPNEKVDFGAAVEAGGAGVLNEKAGVDGLATDASGIGVDAEKENGGGAAFAGSSDFAGWEKLNAGVGGLAASAGLDAGAPKLNGLDAGSPILGVSTAGAKLNLGASAGLAAAAGEGAAKKDVGAPGAAGLVVVSAGLEAKKELPGMSPFAEGAPKLNALEGSPGADEPTIGAGAVAGAGVDDEVPKLKAGTGAIEGVVVPDPG